MCLERDSAEHGEDQLQSVIAPSLMMGSEVPLQSMVSLNPKAYTCNASCREWWSQARVHSLGLGALEGLGVHSLMMPRR